MYCQTDIPKEILLKMFRISVPRMGIGPGGGGGGFQQLYSHKANMGFSLHQLYPQRVKVFTYTLSLCVQN